MKPKQGKAQELKDDLCDVFWRCRVEQQIPTSDAQLALCTGAAKIQSEMFKEALLAMGIDKVFVGWFRMKHLLLPSPYGSNKAKSNICLAITLR